MVLAVPVFRQALEICRYQLKRRVMEFNSITLLFLFSGL